MSTDGLQPSRQSRRDFLAGASALSAAAVLGRTGPAAAEPPPETTKIRLLHTFAICLAPQYLAEELLRLEGFSEVEYVEVTPSVNAAGLLARGGADLSMLDIPSLIPPLDAGKPILLLAGVHAGCQALLGNERVNAIRDLKGKRVGVTVLGSSYLLLSSMVAYVGMNPEKDINWVTGPSDHDAMRLFVEGKVDAFMGFAPQQQELRARKIGHIVIDTGQDRPWSQYFCCGVVGNREFVRRNPVATKRVVRAILKAADICANEPERAARYVGDKGYEPRYEIALEVLKSLPYRRWREGDPEDTLRFHALRLHEVGMIKNTPQKLIAEGTDWRILNELKKELKA